MIEFELLLLLLGLEITGNITPAATNRIIELAVKHPGYLLLGPSKLLLFEKSTLINGLPHLRVESVSRDMLDIHLVWRVLEPGEGD